MKILIFTTLLALSQNALAVSFNVIGRDGQSIIAAEIEADLALPVIDLTLATLTASHANGEIAAFEATELGIRSINDLGNELEILSRKEYKAWGWCYEINGAVPEAYADSTYFTSQEDELTWFYAYAHFDNGEWLAQCQRPDLD